MEAEHQGFLHESLRTDATQEKALAFDQEQCNQDTEPAGVLRPSRRAGVLTEGRGLTRRVRRKIKDKVRLYTFNPRFPFLKEVKDLVARAYEFVPEQEKDIYFRLRKRPRRAGHPL